MTPRPESVLKPCPFCGGEARRVDFDDLPETDPNVGGSLIECTKCSACSAVHFDRKENLESEWNTRAQPATAALREIKRMANEACNAGKLTGPGEYHQRPSEMRAWVKGMLHAARPIRDLAKAALSHPTPEGK